MNYISIAADVAISASKQTQFIDHFLLGYSQGHGFVVQPTGFKFFTPFKVPDDILEPPLRTVLIEVGEETIPFSYSNPAYARMVDTSSNMSIEPYDLPYSVQGRIVVLFGTLANFNDTFRKDIGDFQQYDFVDSYGDPYAKLVIGVTKSTLTEAYIPFKNMPAGCTIAYYDFNDVAGLLSQSTLASGDPIINAVNSGNIAVSKKVTSFLQGYPTPVSQAGRSQSASTDNPGSQFFPG